MRTALTPRTVRTEILGLARATRAYNRIRTRTTRTTWAVRAGFLPPLTLRGACACTASGRSPSLTPIAPLPSPTPNMAKADNTSPRGGAPSSDGEGVEARHGTTNGAEQRQEDQEEQEEQGHDKLTSTGVSRGRRRRRRAPRVDYALLNDALFGTEEECAMARLERQVHLCHP